MQRFTITLDDDLVEEFEQFLVIQGYQNRSEAIRDMMREKLQADRLGSMPDGFCVASMTYVYNHHERDLASRLTKTHHEHHDLTVATLHVHLDHENCMETTILKGPATRVKGFANQTIAEPGVRHGNLYMLPVTKTEQTHKHGEHDLPGHHAHYEPKT